MLRIVAVATYALGTLFQVAIATAFGTQTVAALNGSNPEKSILLSLLLVPLCAPAAIAIRRMFTTRVVLPPVLFERSPIVPLAVIVAGLSAAFIILKGWLSESHTRSEDILGAFVLCVLLVWAMSSITELTIAWLTRKGGSVHRT